MDSLAHRVSSRRWPMMMQAQRSAKNTQSETMVLVLRYEVEESSGDGNIATLSIHLLAQVDNECPFISQLNLLMIITKWIEILMT